MITVNRSVTLKQAKRGRRRITTGVPRPPASPVQRVPRIARLMALAIRFDDLLRSGQVADVTTLARLSHVTQPRMTQILALNLLAPDIQEELLHLPPTEVGKDPIHEKLLRPLAAETDWQRQRQMWRELKPSATERRNAR